MFFDILNKDYNKASYHIEFQTKNDNTMIVRMFEYGFKKGNKRVTSSLSRTPGGFKIFQWQAYVKA